MLEADGEGPSGEVDPGEGGGRRLLESGGSGEASPGGRGHRTVLPGAERVELAQDLGMALQQPGHEDGEQRDHDRLDHDDGGHAFLPQVRGVPEALPKVKTDSAEPEDRAFRIDQVPASNQPTPVRPSPFQSPVTGRPLPPKVKS